MEKDKEKSADSGNDDEHAGQPKDHGSPAAAPLHCDDVATRQQNYEPGECAHGAFKRFKKCIHRPNPRIWDFKFSTVSEAVFAIALIGVGYLQYTVYNRQESDSRAANALSAQINRPFIYIANVKGQTVGPTVYLMPIWTNSGKTPPLQLSIYTNWYRAPRQMRRGFKFLDRNGAGHVVVKPIGVHVPLPPGATIWGQFSFALDRREINQIDSGTVALYSYGWARYRDKLDPKKRHITEYCVRIISVMQPQKSGQTGEVNWHYCRQHNCADQACKKSRSE